jgi:KDO2-lipid IV(A) lauroyltransferase
MAKKKKKKIKQKSRLERFLYALRYRLGEYSLRATMVLLRRLPKGFLDAYARFLARLSFMLLWDYRRRMAENLALALGDEITSERSRKELVWRAWLSFARGVSDTIRVMHLSKQEILSFMELHGEEHIRRALEKGKGVIALSAHLSSFAVIGGRLAAAGYPFSVLVKQPADQRFARLIDGYRAQIGVQTISAKPRREAVRGLLKALRENRIVLVIADEFKSGDVMVDFLGLNVPAPRGPATLALRTGAVTLPMFASRRPDDSLQLTVGEPIVPVEREDLEASVQATTELFTRHLEAAIRRYPDQWNWLGLPRRGGKLSRPQLARLRRERKESPQGADRERLRA